MSRARRLPRCLPVLDWSEDDQKAWKAATRKGDILDGTGAASSWRQPTRRFIVQAVGRFLGWVIDEYKGELIPVPDCLTPDIVKAYCGWLEDRVAPFTVLGHIRDLVEYMRVAWPDQDRRLLQQAERSLQWRAVPTKDKRSRLKPIPELVQLGQQLMSISVGINSGDPRLPLTTYRDGFAIVLLALRPLRIRAFASLELGVHLIQSGERWKIVIPASLSKTNRPWEADFPASLIPALTHYLEIVRPRLMQLRGRWYSDPGRALWISNDGSALKPKALAEAIVKRTGQAFGHPISPHFFRDCAATTLAHNSPENVRLATPLLGHASPKMTEKHYNQASQIRAGHKHIDALARLRRGLQ